MILWTNIQSIQTIMTINTAEGSDAAKNGAKGKIEKLDFFLSNIYPLHYSFSTHSSEVIPRIEYLQSYECQNCSLRDKYC